MPEKIKIKIMHKRRIGEGGGYKQFWTNKRGKKIKIKLRRKGDRMNGRNGITEKRKERNPKERKKEE